jgi:hypothetical protein
MAKPDLFRMFGCVVMVTLIIVIAVKLSKQCMPASGSASGSPSAKAYSKEKYSEQGKGQDVCEAGFRPDENGFCVEDV